MNAVPILASLPVGACDVLAWVQFASLRQAVSLNALLAWRTGHELAGAIEDNIWNALSNLTVVSY
jgi:hypothetical protein